MTVSVADIDRWNAGDVREVFHATRSQAEAAFEAADGIAQLPAFESWGGDAAEAAKEAIGRTRKDLDAHGNQAIAVSRAASTAADDIDALKNDLAELRAKAMRLQMALNPATNTFQPTDPTMPPAEAMAKAASLLGELRPLLARGAAIEDELARAIEMATGEAPIPDTPHDNRPEIQAALSRPLPTDPEEFEQLWNQLTPEEKDWLYRQDPNIGNHPGMPWVGTDGLGKDHYNRLHLKELTRSAQAEVDRLAQAHPGWAQGVTPNPKSEAKAWRDWQEWKKQWDGANHTLAGYQSVSETLARNDGVPRYLGMIDDQGHAAVAINNPDTASRTATLVPGTGQDMAAFAASDGKSLDMYNAAMNADRSLRVGDVSVISWMGYDRPMDLGEAASASYANNGASALDAYLDGLQATHLGPPSIDTVIGHSYGSTLVGAAGAGDHHLAVENVIAVGSPGMIVSHAADLSLDPGGNVYATRAANDVIEVVGSSPVHVMTGGALGNDPTWDPFGAVELVAAPGPPSFLNLPSVAAHSSYWDEGNPALLNMGAIIAGKPPPYVTPP
ncbi:alpha/beta hydrolase family protein [Mycobacterium sp. MYCO198283]|uniref:alpha/beta hydrolase n=1 Tax=Mycobacterium sp. MYCO198283 TaxID=2883505 RepID=UPI001E3BD13D|nr:alpha/beta hydrolase [Mycobacterium sp. MYCO198283]MCG5431058.1 alpha/beta hydrolase family protein [Mycobacterium sp. MYCO198283]